MWNSFLPTHVWTEINDRDSNTPPRKTTADTVFLITVICKRNKAALFQQDNSTVHPHGTFWIKRHSVSSIARIYGTCISLKSLSSSFVDCNEMVWFAYGLKLLSHTKKANGKQEFIGNLPSSCYTSSVVRSQGVRAWFQYKITLFKFW